MSNGQNKARVVSEAFEGFSDDLESGFESGAAPSQQALDAVQGLDLDAALNDSAALEEGATAFGSLPADAKANLPGTQPSQGVRSSAFVLNAFEGEEPEASLADESVMALARAIVQSGESTDPEFDDAPGIGGSEAGMILNNSPAAAVAARRKASVKREGAQESDAERIARNENETSRETWDEAVVLDERPNPGARAGKGGLSGFSRLVGKAGQALTDKDAAQRIMERARKIENTRVKKAQEDEQERQREVKRRDVGKLLDALVTAWTFGIKPDFDAPLPAFIEEARASLQPSAADAEDFDIGGKLRAKRALDAVASSSGGSGGGPRTERGPDESFSGRA